MQPNHPDDAQPWRDEDEALETPQRYWTTRRIVLILIALLILISLLAEYAAPLMEALTQPTPLPPFVPNAPLV